jgi:hypothetical protein
MFVWLCKVNVLEGIMCMDFVHHPLSFQKHNVFGNWICFHLQVKRRWPGLRLAPSKGPSRVGATF